MASDLLATPSITCCSCRLQVSVDVIETHECHPDDLATAAARKSVGGSEPSILAAATKAGGAFVEALLSPSQDSVRHAERAEPSSSPQGQRQFERSHSSSSTTDPIQTSPTQSESGSPTHSPRIGRALSTSTPGESEVAPLHSALLDHPRQRSLSGEEPLIQCRVKGVRVNKDRVALYSITSSVVKKDSAAGSFISSSLISALGIPPTSYTQEVVIERRYREFYAFALTVYAMFPSTELWMRLPPKTLCFLKNTRHDGFLLRRKRGLDDFIRCAIDRMSLGSAAQGTIGQWYLVRKFLNLPATLLSAPTKDRSLAVAMEEIKANAHQAANWIPAGWDEEHGAVYERMGDAFSMVKRVRQCGFPARAIYDMIVKSNQGSVAGGVNARASGDSSWSLLEAKAPSLSASPAASSMAPPWNPLVESEEILRREDGHTWVERTVFKVRALYGCS